MALLSADQVLELLDDPRSALVLRQYFAINAPSGSPVFSGRRFDFLDPGCRQDEDRDRITAVDLVAVQCLSVTVPIDVALDLLEGQLGSEVGDLLSRIPTGIALGTGTARTLLGPGREADTAWHLLEARVGVGWVTAGKLMARKRPDLIPVWDRIVRCAFGRCDGVWLCLDGLLRAQDGAVLHRLAKLREDTGVPERVSLLRILDVVVWMRHHASHLSNDCPGLLTKP